MKAVNALRERIAEWEDPASLPYDLRLAREALAELSVFDGPYHVSELEAIETYDRLWHAVVDVRDNAPRHPQDASTDDVLFAVIQVLTDIRLGR